MKYTLALFLLFLACGQQNLQALTPVTLDGAEQKLPEPGLTFNFSQHLGLLSSLSRQDKEKFALVHNTQVYFDARHLGFARWQLGVSLNHLPAQNYQVDYFGFSMMYRFFEGGGLCSQNPSAQANLSNNAYSRPSNNLAYAALLCGLAYLFNGQQADLPFVASIGPQLGIQDRNLILGLNLEAEYFLLQKPAFQFSLPLRTEFFVNQQQLRLNFFLGLRLYL